MVKFAYNNVKNIDINYISFELNYRYYFCIFYKKYLDFYSKSKIIKKSSFKL